MKIDPDTLRRSYRGYTASRRPPNRKKCPPPAAIAKSFEPSYSVRKKKRIVDHITDCAFCRDEFLMFLELRRSEDAAEGGSDPTVAEDGNSGREKVPAFARTPLWQYACILFGLCLAVSSYVLFVQRGDGSESRHGGKPDILLLSPKAGRTISSSLLFRWRRDPAAEYYVVELFDEQLLPVWRSDIVRDLEARLPAEVFSRLLPDRSYYWMVTGFSQESKSSESVLARFKIDR